MSVAPISLITQLDHDHILVSQSVLVIVSGLHEVTKGVSNCTKLYGNCIKTVHTSKMKRLHILPTLHFAGWYTRHLKMFLAFF